MNIDPLRTWNRRDFLRTLGIAGAATAAGIRAEAAFAEPPPEITSLRIINDSNIPVLCWGPQYIARKLLYLEGFDQVSYVSFDSDYSGGKVVARGKADISASGVDDILRSADAYPTIVTLSGMHPGCTEIFGSNRVRTFGDLKGKKVAVYAFESPEHVLFSTIFAYIGLDPERDIEWTLHPYEDWGPLLSADKVDAIMLWPPHNQIFREKGIGHVIWSNTTDRPWRNYFCCMVTGNRDFVSKYPIATKRALRATLKAMDMCAFEPERAARAVIEDGFPTDFDRAVQVFKEVPYGAWRTHDPVDTLRFYAVRLHELGFVQKTPEVLIQESSDWRFLNELRRELEA